MTADGAVRFDARQLTLVLDFDPPGGITLEATGQLVATMGDEEVAIAFSHYIEQFISEETIVISGDITGPCLEGWATISTSADDPIVTAGSSCPFDSGAITISGADDQSIMATFPGNDSIAIGAAQVLTYSEVMETACALQ